MTRDEWIDLRRGELIAELKADGVIVCSMMAKAARRRAEQEWETRLDPTP